MPLPENKITELIDGVYSGEISLFELPSSLYAFTLTELNSSLVAGFGDVPKGAIKEIEKAVNFRENIGRFSGVKTFQNVKDLTAIVFDADGKKTPFAQFKQEALKINEKYNVDWLRTEQNSVFSQSQNARKELKMISEAAIFPMARYVTVGDDRVDPAHAALNGLTLPVNHPKWDTISPQNRFNCRCIKIQLEATRATSVNEVEQKTRLVEADFKKQRAAKSMSFDYNPGKVDFIFREQGKGKHPYFRVPREFSDELKNNFNLAPVSEIIGKKI